MFKKVSFKKVFLFDGIGALMTAFMLLVVLTNFQPYIGMSKVTLQWLGFAAVVFAFYSFSCYLFLKGRWIPFLRVIAIANSAYCLVTLILIFTLWNSLTPLGIVYFLGEIALVMTLVRFEWQKTMEMPS